MEYDYLIVGAGLYGSVFAREMTDKGKKCLVIDKRNHIGGNVYTEKIEGINVHKYGIHIFHCNDKKTWDYVNRFTEFKSFVNSPIANYKGELYNLPFNMNTFYQLWGVTDPVMAKIKIAEQIIPNASPKNLEEAALATLGVDIYKKLVYGYTLKQWGVEPRELPPFIIKRLPLRFTFDNNYYNHRYQGVPVDGYTKMFENMLLGIEVRLGIDFLKDREHLESLADKIVYTGKIDEFFGYEYGKLDYRSLFFSEYIFDVDNYQGVACMNYTHKDVPHTRTIEHKHIGGDVSDKTVVTFEYSRKYDGTNDAYYPINDERNNTLYDEYKERTKLLPNYIFGGRLAEYKYYDMNNIIEKIINQ